LHGKNYKAIKQNDLLTSSSWRIYLYNYYSNF